MNDNHQRVLPNNNNSNNERLLLYSINGQQIAYTYVSVEHQTRGTSHTHQLIWLPQQQNLPPQ